MRDKIKLAERIDKFIIKYAGIRPDYDVEFDDMDDKYTSPDAYEMIKCSMLLKLGKPFDRCFSEWSSGGYIPYESIEGKKEHDSIMSELMKIITEQRIVR